ncbi:hypothetical protein MBLNU230_g7725t1 [Neophaeotheca triangularis]
MSSPLSVKRRKVNHATNVLAKPFVSPLKRTAADQSTSQEQQPNTSRTDHRPYTPSTLAHTISTSSSPAAERTKSTATPRANTVRARPSYTPITGGKRRDPEEIAAQRAITSLELQIRSLRHELETLTQAQQLSTSSTDDELVVLTDKWRSAAQQAAEELFGSVHDRVCRMGGVAAWREAEKSKFDKQHGLGEYAQQDEGANEDDDADCEFDSQGEELPEDEQEWRRKKKRRVREEMAAAADVPAEGEGEGEAEVANSRVWQDPGKEDDAFTMDMMLRSLNIELDVIGYDKREQRWVA